MRRTTRANSGGAPPTLEQIKKMKNDFYAQSQSVVAVDYIIDFIIDKGTRQMYNRYLNKRFPRHFAKTYTEYLGEAGETYVMAYDINNPKNAQHVISEDPEPVIKVFISIKNNFRFYQRLIHT